jgi:hypothetical protein
MVLETDSVGIHDALLDMAARETLSDIDVF